MKYENKFEAIKRTIEKERAEQEEKFKTVIIRERSDAKESSRHTLKGRIGEQMSPLFPEFYSKYQPSDARFLGSPIDYIIFKDMSKYDRKTKAEDVPIDVVLVEVKSGKNTKLTEKEEAVRNAVEEGRVSFDVIKQNIEPQKEPIQKEPIQKEPIQKESIQKNKQKKAYSVQEIKKKYPNAYEPWTKSEDEFLKNYWNDKSNLRSRYFKIEEVAEKFGRQPGAINSRIFKLELEVYRKKVEEKSSMHQLD